jgi:hypothetical protein
MPFIGQQPLTGAYSKLDSITTSATATYNLQLGGSAYSPASANHLLVSLNGVMQAPQDSFTVSGSTITFASALTSSDNIDFIMAMGDVLNIGTPSDGTVTSGKIASGAVTSAKLDTNIAISGNLTTGNTSIVTGGRFISSQTSNDPWLKGVNSSNTETSYIKKDGQIYSAFGISIGGTGAANTLDDYEEGTWTPILTGYSGGSNQTYASRSGNYIKIGRQVIANFYVRLSNKGNISGSYALISGLPFPHQGSYAGTGVLSYVWSLANARDNIGIEMGGSTPNQGWLTFMDGTSSGYMSTSDLNNNTGFQGTLIYYTS